MKKSSNVIAVIMIGLFGFCLNIYADVIIDFNASGLAVSSSDSRDGDIIEPFVWKQNGVTLTVSPRNPSNLNENRFWGTINGPQLRCYSGSITIEANVPITSIIFDAPLHFDLTPDNGTLTNNTWTGESEKVVFTVNKNTQINKIEVITKIVDKCATPSISFANGKLLFECDTEGVEFISSVTIEDSNMLHSNQVELFSVYSFNVYAKKDGYIDSDVASVNIDLNKLKGDMNNDGNISIADVVALVNIILGGSAPTLYYSVGTDAVTADNYTTANNAQQVNSLSSIPSTLLTVTTPGVYYILLPDQFEPEVGGVVYYNVTKLNVNIPSYSVYRTASLSAGVQIKRVNVGTSGSQIDYE